MWREARMGSTTMQGSHFWEGLAAPISAVILTLILAPGVWASTETVLYSFCSQSNCSDGAWPTAGPTFDKAGNLYGTTEGGGANLAGLVWELKHTKSGWSEDVLYTFTGGNDGGAPTGSLVLDKAGNVYGTANTGGSAGSGAVFELTPSNGSGYGEH
jgi:hypothetical protein